MAVQYREKKDNQNLLTGGQGGVISSGAGAPAKATSSGRFQNIQGYLNANKSSNLAGQIGQNLQKDTQGVQAQVHESKDKFDQEAQGARQQYDDQFVKSTIDNAASAASPEVEKFKSMRDAEYKGPADLQNSQSLQQNVQNVRSLAQSGATEAGRFNLLKNYFNKPSYTRGQQTLDNLLIQANPEQNRQLQQSRVYGNQAQRELVQNRTAAQQAADQFKQEALQTQNQTRQELSTAQTEFEKQLQERTLQQKQQQEALFGNMDKSIQEKELDDDTYNRLRQGLSLDIDSPLYNVDPSRFISKAWEPTIQTVAGEADYDRYSGLSNLASKDPTLLTDRSLAGQYERLGPVNYDQQGFQQAYELAKTAYDKDEARLNREAAMRGKVAQGQRFEDTLNQVEPLIQQMTQKGSGLDPNAYDYNKQLTNSRQITEILGQAPDQYYSQELLNRIRSTLAGQYYGDTGQGYGNIYTPELLKQDYNNQVSLLRSQKAQEEAAAQAAVRKRQEELGYFDKLKKKVTPSA
jgi:hypothetical protein